MFPTSLFVGCQEAFIHFESIFISFIQLIFILNCYVLWTLLVNEENLVNRTDTALQDKAAMDPTCQTCFLIPA